MASKTASEAGSDGVLDVFSFFFSRALRLLLKVGGEGFNLRAGSIFRVPSAEDPNVSVLHCQGSILG